MAKMKFSQVKNADLGKISGKISPAAKKEIFKLRVKFLKEFSKENSQIKNIDLRKNPTAKDLRAVSSKLSKTRRKVAGGGDLYKYKDKSGYHIINVPEGTKPIEIKNGVITAQDKHNKKVIHKFSTKINSKRFAFAIQNEDEFYYAENIAARQPEAEFYRIKFGRYFNKQYGIIGRELLEEDLLDLQEKYYGYCNGKQNPPDIQIFGFDTLEKAAAKNNDKEIAKNKREKKAKLKKLKKGVKNAKRNGK